MAVFYHNTTEVDPSGNVYVAGSTLNAANNNDIILQKFNRSGVLLWQETFNGAANMDELLDATGRNVAKHDLSNLSAGHQSVKVNISNLSSGLYLCNLYVGGERISKRIVKQ